MSEEITALDDAKRRIKVEQTVRDFLHVLDQHELTMEEGLVAWNMLGFTIFQEMFPDKTHQEIQGQMTHFSENLFISVQS